MAMADHVWKKWKAPTASLVACCCAAPSNIPSQFKILPWKHPSEYRHLHLVGIEGVHLFELSESMEMNL
jgi:hypothetical protein